jgi:ferrous iron transport protein A
MFPLGLLVSGERAEVVEKDPAAGHALLLEHCQSGGNCCRKGATVRIEDMGIRPGKTVEMLNNGGGGALLVKVDEARIAVGRSMAMKIMVRRKDDEPGDA